MISRFFRICEGNPLLTTLSENVDTYGKRTQNARKRTRAFFCVFERTHGVCLDYGLDKIYLTRVK